MFVVAASSCTLGPGASARRAGPGSRSAGRESRRREIRQCFRRRKGQRRGRSEAIPGFSIHLALPGFRAQSTGMQRWSWLRPPTAAWWIPSCASVRSRSADKLHGRAASSRPRAARQSSEGARLAGSPLQGPRGRAMTALPTSTLSTHGPTRGNAAFHTPSAPHQAATCMHHAGIPQPTAGGQVLRP